MEDEGTDELDGAAEEVEGRTPVPVPTWQVDLSQPSYCAVSFAAHEAEMQLWTMFPGWREQSAPGEEMLYCPKQVLQHAGMPGWLGTPVGCGNEGAVPDMVGKDELVSKAIELDDVDSAAGYEDEVLGAGAALPVLPRQNDCTHP